MFVGTDERYCESQISRQHAFGIYATKAVLIPQHTLNKAFGMSLRCVVRQEGGGENKE